MGSRVEGFVSTINPDGRIFLLLKGPGLTQLDELLDEMNKIYSSKVLRILYGFVISSRLLCYVFEPLVCQARN